MNRGESAGSDTEGGDTHEVCIKSVFLALGTPRRISSEVPGERSVVAVRGRARRGRGIFARLRVSALDAPADADNPTPEHRPLPQRKWLALSLGVVIIAGLLSSVLALTGVARAGTTVGPPVGCTGNMNPVQCENLQPGTPQVDSPLSIPYSSIGDPSIQGFSTSMSVDVGQTVYFKVDAPGVSAWHINIFRMGYYQGLGSREWASNITPSVSLPQSQPTVRSTRAGAKPPASSTAATGQSRRRGRSPATPSRACTSLCSSATTPEA